MLLNNSVIYLKLFYGICVVETGTAFIDAVKNGNEVASQLFHYTVGTSIVVPVRCQEAKACQSTKILTSTEAIKR